MMPVTVFPAELSIRCQKTRFSTEARSGEPRGSHRLAPTGRMPVAQSSGSWLLAANLEEVTGQQHGFHIPSLLA